MSRPSIGSFILTFNRPETVRETIERVLDQQEPPDALVVLDNSPEETARSVAESFASRGVEYVPTGENLGSAGGVSYGMQMMFDRGFDWIQSIDDDDPPRTGDTTKRMRALIDRHTDDGLGALGTSGSRWDWDKGEHRRFRDDELAGDLEIDTIGGNGHLTVRREVIAELGPPNRDFFFGFYDPLYCLLIRRAGHKIMVDGDMMLAYRTDAGKLDFDRGTAWRPRDPYHAIWRRYYVTRNYIYRMRNTFEREDLARREVVKAVKRSASSWAHGPRYGVRFTHMQMKGVIDGSRGTLGRRVEPTAKPAAR